MGETTAVKYVVVDDSVRDKIDVDLLERMKSGGFTILSTKQVRSLSTAAEKEVVRAVRRRQYYSKPEVQEKRKMYYSREDVKQQRKDYNRREDVKNRKRQAQKQRSELISRLREVNPELYKNILNTITPEINKHEQ